MTRKKKLERGEGEILRLAGSRRKNQQKERWKKKWEERRRRSGIFQPEFLDVVIRSREREREKERKVVGGRLLILVTFTSGVRDPVRVRVAPQKLHSTLDAALFQPVFYSRRISSPLFSSPPRFLTVIENLRPPFLSLSLPSFLFFSFSFSTRSWAAPGAGICIEQPLSGALDAGLSFPFYRGRGIVRATLACSVGEIVSSLGWT